MGKTNMPRFYGSLCIVKCLSNIFPYLDDSIAFHVQIFETLCALIINVNKLQMAIINIMKFFDSIY